MRSSRSQNLAKYQPPLPPTPTNQQKPQKNWRCINQSFKNSQKSQTSSRSINLQQSGTSRYQPKKSKQGGSSTQRRPSVFSSKSAQKLPQQQLQAHPASTANGSYGGGWRGTKKSIDGGTTLQRLIDITGSTKEVKRDAMSPNTSRNFQKQTYGNILPYQMTQVKSEYQHQQQQPGGSKYKKDLTPKKSLRRSLNELDPQIDHNFTRQQSSRPLNTVPSKSGRNIKSHHNILNRSNRNNENSPGANFQRIQQGQIINQSVQKEAKHSKSKSKSKASYHQQPQGKKTKLRSSLSLKNYPPHPNKYSKANSKQLAKSKQKYFQQQQSQKQHMQQNILPQSQNVSTYLHQQQQHPSLPTPAQGLLTSSQHKNHYNNHNDDPIIENPDHNCGHQNYTQHYQYCFTMPIDSSRQQYLDQNQDDMSELYNAQQLYRRQSSAKELLSNARADGNNIKEQEDRANRSDKENENNNKQSNPSQNQNHNPNNSSFSCCYCRCTNHTSTPTTTTTSIPQIVQQILQKLREQFNEYKDRIMQQLNEQKKLMKQTVDKIFQGFQQFKCQLLVSSGQLRVLARQNNLKQVSSVFSQSSEQSSLQQKQYQKQQPGTYHWKMTPKNQQQQLTHSQRFNMQDGVIQRNNHQQQKDYRKNKSSPKRQQRQKPDWSDESLVQSNDHQGYEHRHGQPPRPQSILQGMVMINNSKNDNLQNQQNQQNQHPQKYMNYSMKIPQLQKLPQQNQTSQLNRDDGFVVGVDVRLESLQFNEKGNDRNGNQYQGQGQRQKQNKEKHNSVSQIVLHSRNPPQQLPISPAHSHSYHDNKQPHRLPSSASSTTSRRSNSRTKELLQQHYQNRQQSNRYPRQPNSRFKQPSYSRSPNEWKYENSQKISTNRSPNNTFQSQYPTYGNGGGPNTTNTMNNNYESTAHGQLQKFYGAMERLKSEMREIKNISNPRQQRVGRLQQQQ